MINDSGQATFARAHTRVFANGIRTFTGNSRNTSKRVLTTELNDIQSKSPWQVINNGATTYRNPYQCFGAFLEVMIDAPMVQGYSDYHHTCVHTDDIKQADTDTARKWHLNVGDRYYEFDIPIYICLKGDDAPIANLPKEMNSICATFLCICFWNCPLSHCTHSAMATLISGENSKLPHIIDLHQAQITELNKTDRIGAFSKNKQCYMLFTYKHFQNGDWVFAHVQFTRTLGPTAFHFLHGITHFIDGEPYMLPNRLKDLYVALQAGIEPANYTPNLAELRARKFNGYVLTNDEIAHYMGGLVEAEFVRRREASNAATRARYDNDVKYAHDKRRDIANEFSTAILYQPTNLRIFLGIFEIFHCFMQNVSRSVNVLSVLMYIRWGWAEREVLQVTN